MRSSRSPGFLMVFILMAALLFSLDFLKPSHAAPPEVAQAAKINADHFCAECATVTQAPAYYPPSVLTQAAHPVEQFMAVYPALIQTQGFYPPPRRIYYAAVPPYHYTPRGPDHVPRISRRHAVSAT